MNRPYKILIVEDDAPISELIALTLSSPEYGITCADNGKEALVRLSQESIDLVVLDILIPPPDGWEIYRAIRSSPRLGNTKVIILTALGFLPGYVKGKNLAKTDMIMKKPFELEELRSNVKNMFMERQSADAR